MKGDDKNMLMVLSICCIIAYVCYFSDFIREEKKLNKKRYENKRKKKNRNRFNIDVR